MYSKKTNNFSHIKFGFRGEGIIYNLNGKEYKIWSTYGGGTTLFMDDLTKTNLNEEQKTILFTEIIKFINEKEKDKPTIYYNLDSQDAPLWDKLTTELSSEINGIARRNTQQKNISDKCENCFVSEIKKIETHHDHQLIEENIQSKINSNKIVRLNEKPEWIEQFKCNSCGQIWQLDHPENAHRGCLLTIENAIKREQKLTNNKKEKSNGFYIYIILFFLILIYIYYQL